MLKEDQARLRHAYNWCNDVIALKYGKRHGEAKIKFAQAFLVVLEPIRKESIMSLEIKNSPKPKAKPKPSFKAEGNERKVDDKGNGLLF